MTKPGLKGFFPPTSTTAAIKFELAAGTCLVLTGPSGIGKSTLLRKIADLDPHSGEVTLGHQNQSDFFAPVWRQKVMYVASNAGWWKDRVGDHFVLDDETFALLDGLGISKKKLDDVPHHLSSGERQRLALVRALTLHPDFLLLDEPTSALDPDTTLKVETVLMARKHTGCGLLIVTHNMAQAERLADGQIIMQAV